MPYRGPETAKPPQPVLACLSGAGVGILGGLLGLGGAEFRLPLLVGLFGYGLWHAVHLNLAISLVTVLTALVTRLALRGAGAEPLAPFTAAAAGMIAGGVMGAHVAVRWFARVPEAQLHLAVRALLLGIGVLLLVEAAVSWAPATVMRSDLGQLTLGLVAGVAIGAVSSLLGVAGGELIIPTLIFGFGAAVKVAGTLSLLISTPTIVVGLWRHRSHGRRLDRADLRALVGPMAVGSVAGAVVGGALVPSVPVAVVKTLLGLVLIAAALRVFSPTRAD